jgi:ribosomal protein S18 acetylase RimI-like enzyme
MNGTVTVEYRTDYGPDLVRMWRDSFEQAVGIGDPHTLEEQLRFLKNEVIPGHAVVIVLDQATEKVVGFLAAASDKISQLYVHVDHQGKGIGSMLVNLAKQNSSGRLHLFTFDCNKKAQRFYENHGFKIVGRGFEKSWQLADIEYEWRAATSVTEANYCCALAKQTIREPV